LVEKKDDDANRKIRRLYTTEKGKQAYPFLKREGDHSNSVALTGLSDDEAETLFQLLQRVRKNIEIEWDYVKKGNKREY
jgi:DNA-binding MarR family transcriptional regulator